MRLRIYQEPITTITPLDTNHPTTYPSVYGSLIVLLPFLLCVRYCYERNDTDLVGATCPGAGAQRSWVKQEQYPRTAGQIALLTSGGTGLGSEGPPAATYG
ncbi:putative succinate--CoA ligase [Trichinella spiralis]|uniref:putative succinate--CoA ligase n=1 Tax=Trichinella spiralis TaxID=6334 RepID=UPI0001EFD592|nr:putative succinate--CoA ligase [Trichinella spiralis]